MRSTRCVRAVVAAHMAELEHDLLETVFDETD